MYKGGSEDHQSEFFSERFYYGFRFWMKFSCGFAVLRFCGFGRSFVRVFGFSVSNSPLRFPAHQSSKNETLLAKKNIYSSGSIGQQFFQTLKHYLMNTSKSEGENPGLLACHFAERKKKPLTFIDPYL